MLKLRERFYKNLNIFIKRFEIFFLMKISHTLTKYFELSFNKMCVFVTIHV